MIVYIDGKQMVMCDACYRRWPRDEFAGTEWVQHALCTDCQHIAKPRVVPASETAWCGTPALSRTWAQGQEDV